MSTTGKVILITGASSGIGEATAIRLAADGHQLYLGARRTDRLVTLTDTIRQSGGTAEHARLDVAVASDVDAFASAAREHFGRIDVLINNAGVMPLSRLAEGKTDEWNQMIDVNIRGVLHGINAVLPTMQDQGAGHIINIASTGAYRVIPTAAVYSATKFAVRAISEGLRQESPGIRVTIVSPGVTESELAESISDPAARDYMKAFRANAIPASSVADAIAYAIGQPPNVDVSEIIVQPTVNG